MTDTQSFADRIRERYPEGLTGLFAIGATRRTYIIEQQRHRANNPGHIDDFQDMGAFLQHRYNQFIADFYALGGQNMVITALSYRSFFERGPEYAEKVVPEALRLIDDLHVDFYREHEIDPRFTGLEILQSPSASAPMRELAEKFQAFMADWDYQQHRKKLFWEIAPMPLLSFWQTAQNMSEAERHALDAQLANASSFAETQTLLYEHFTKAALGTSLPMPHLYMGTNMGGDLKFRAPLLLSLTAGEYLRAYYTPYPTLFITKESFQRILEDLAFGKRLHAPENYDYSGRYTAELIDAEYQRIQVLTQDPQSILGLTRTPTAQK